MDAHFNPAFDRTRPARSGGPDLFALRGYAICTAPRSGSNFLPQLLYSTGVLGNPLEYFNGSGRRALDDPTYPDDPGEQVQRVLTTGKTPNGVYALKMFAYQFLQVETHIRLSRDLPNLHFVFLRRRDILGQAISWARALQTNQYRSTQRPTGEAMYDRVAISERLHAIIEEYGRWHFYFARNGSSPIEIVYEDMLESPQTACDRVASLFGLEGQATIQAERIDLVIQRDAVNEEWRRRFVAEEGDLDQL